MLSTLEDRRLTEGDRVRVSIGAATYEAEIVDAGDPAKLKVQLDSGARVWIGRKCVAGLVTQD